MSSLYGCRSFSHEQKVVTGQLLVSKVGGEHLATRSGGAAGNLTYIEGWKSIELANSIFGFEGWSSSVELINTDFVEETSGKVRVGATAVVRIELKDGSFHEDVGYGQSERNNKGMAIEHAKKEAVTDARKRALRFFGNALGNSIYDKEHLKSVKAGKVAVGALSYEGLRTGAAFIHKSKPPPFLTSGKNNSSSTKLSITTTPSFSTTTATNNNQPINNTHQIKNEKSTPTTTTAASATPASFSFSAMYSSATNNNNSSNTDTNTNMNGATNTTSPLVNRSSSNNNLSTNMMNNMLNNINNSSNNSPYSKNNTQPQNTQPPQGSNDSSPRNQQSNQQMPFINTDPNPHLNTNTNPNSGINFIADDSFDNDMFVQIADQAIQAYQQSSPQQQQQQQQQHQQPHTPSPSRIQGSPNQQQTSSSYLSSFQQSSPNAPYQHNSSPSYQQPQQRQDTNADGTPPDKKRKFIVDVSA